MAERMIPGVWYRSKTFDVLLRKENMPEIVDGVLTIPDEVTTIDAYSFNDCPPFRELIVPENVLYIESNEKLLNCPEFRKITFLNRDGRMRFLNYHRDKSVPEVLTYRIAKTDKYTVFLEGEPPATDESEICIGAEFHSMNHRGLSLMKICIEGKNGVYGSGFTPVEARRNLYLRLKNDHSPEQYNGLTIESTVQWEEAVAMVDIILER